MRNNQIRNVDYLKERRRELRNNLTPAEAALWKLLKGGQLKEKKFRRQQSVLNYIADFYCPAEKLIIELDGEVHNNPVAAEKDRLRDEELGAMGYKILRFENKLVFDHPEYVLEKIQESFNK